MTKQVHELDEELDPQRIKFIMTKQEKERLIAEEKRKKRARAKTAKPQIH